MTEYYLAIDIGASSGRHILSHIENGKIMMEEIHRFDNGTVERNGHIVWETERLFDEILRGMKKCGELGKIPKSVGIDTWGVDFALLDADDRLIGDVVGYRDSRNDGMAEQVYGIISETELYEHTGIQYTVFNTIFQLYAVKLQNPEYLREAKTLLMVPDYFHFLLTGVKAAEYTIASTSQLVNAADKTWDLELIERLGFPAEIFPEIKAPGTSLGNLRPEIAKIVGYDTEVVLPASHDTGSAVLAVPAQGDVVYISSGTWSLMGVERMTPDCSDESRRRNFTNEGGYQYRYRYLKNLMGLWMIQRVRGELKEKGENYTYGELCDGASKAAIASLVPCNDQRFLNPVSMIDEIRNCLAESGQELPKTTFELAAVVYNSLAVCYRETIGEIESLSGRTYPEIHIVGGGSQAEYLCELTAEVTGKTVYAGPVEATAIGNTLVQMMADGIFEDLASARACIFDSFAVKTYRA